MRCGLGVVYFGAQIEPKWRNRQTRTTQNRVPSGNEGSIPSFGTADYTLTDILEQNALQNVEGALFFKSLNSKTCIRPVFPLLTFEIQICKIKMKTGSSACPSHTRGQGR